MRNSNVDILKLLCALFVIMIHVNYFGRQWLLPITRCAVPIFLIISGYYLYSPDCGLYKVKKSLKHVTLILINSTILFAVINTLLQYHSTGSISIPNRRSILNFIVFNENPWAYHLWYLSAYIYVLLIVDVCQQKKCLKYLYYCIPILLLTDLVFGKYSLLIWNQEYNYLYLRNFLFVGIPYFLIGGLIRKNYHKLNNSKRICFYGIIMSVVLSLSESYFLRHMGLNATRDHYLGTTFLAVFLFLFTIQLSSRKDNILSIIGRKDSMYIYVLHPLIITGFVVFNGILPFPEWYNYVYNKIAPILILIVTCIFVFIIRKLRIIPN